nr:unnamed protein product [Digitaria exilis]
MQNWMTMHPYALRLFLATLAVTLAAAAGVHGLAADEGTTSINKFWEQALPGSPMPEAIARLVEKGIHQSPLDPNTPVSIVESLGRWQCYLMYTWFCPPVTTAVPAGVFFRQGQARVGHAVEAHLPAGRALPGLLSREAEARAPPFGDLAAVLSRTHGLRGCATSLEATVDAATRMLTGDEGVLMPTRNVWATASALPIDGLPRQLYEVAAVDTLDGDRHVVCHAYPYPYTVYRCHMTSSTRAFVLKLRHRGAGGPEVAAVAAICHLDTSDWTPTHPVFKALDTKPGGAPVCHFIPYGHLVFGNNRQQAAQGSTTTTLLMKRSIDDLLQTAAGLVV